MRTAVAALLAAFILTAPAVADTTYVYGSPRSFVGSVTFNFDTANFTGNIFVSDPRITDLEFGATVTIPLNGEFTFIATLDNDGFLNSYFDLFDGKILNWKIATGFFNCGLTICFIDGSLPDWRTGMPVDLFDQTCDACPQDFFHTQAASGQWALATPVPDPIIGTGLPGLMLVGGLIGLWWRRTRAPKYFEPSGLR